MSKDSQPISLTKASIQLAVPRSTVESWCTVYNVAEITVRRINGKGKNMKVLMPDQFERLKLFVKYRE
jgi:hypothetical protein